MRQFQARLQQNRGVVFTAGAMVVLSAVFSMFSCNKGAATRVASNAAPRPIEQKAPGVQSPALPEITVSADPLERVAQKLAREKAAAASREPVTGQTDVAPPPPSATDTNPTEEANQAGIDPSVPRCPEGSVPVGAPPPKGNLFWCSAKTTLGTGEKNGPYLKWDNDGNKRFEAYYVNGQPHGRMISYFADEREEELKEFSNGVLNGKWIQWNREGDKVAEGVFVNGKKNGKFSYWDRHGALTSEGTYKNNLEFGVWTTFYPDGEIQTRITYRDGKKNGKAETFFTSGRLSSTGAYRDNKLEGEWVYYNEDGRLKVRGAYADGRKNGPWSTYKPDGQLADTTMYDNGHAIRERNRQQLGSRTQSARSPDNSQRWVEM
ncbi:MAG: hypothetical protein U0136_15275 [Bdellovibrionota bacterium]